MLKMKTSINQKRTTALNLNPCESEMIHIIAFEYSIADMMIETDLCLDKVNQIIQKLHDKSQTQSYVGLVRWAFEVGVLRLIQI